MKINCSIYNYAITICLCLVFIKCSHKNEWQHECLQDEIVDVNIFKPCREFHYQAKYWKDYELLSTEQLRLVSSGSRWRYDSSQLTAYFIYENDHRNEKALRNSGTNEVLKDSAWINYTESGIIESARNVFIHPFRSNQYNFTELAPFPDVMIPLSEGLKWRSTLNIGYGWGDWTDWQVISVYEVLGMEEFSLNGKDYTCWKIFAVSNHNGGSSYLTTLFNENLGFVKMSYANDYKQTLEIEMVDVKEN